jgi:hypothetical protein
MAYFGRADLPADFHMRAPIHRIERNWICRLCHKTPRDRLYWKGNPQPRTFGFLVFG